MSELLTNPEDFASKLSETEREHNAAEVRRKAQPKQVCNPDGTWPAPDCVECGLPIGVKRLEAIGADTCIDCASAKERDDRFFAKS